MTPLRKKRQDFILEKVQRIAPGVDQTSFYKQFFETLSDKQFDEWVEKLYKQEAYLIVVSPNLSEGGIDYERNIQYGKELGLEMLQQIWIEDPESGRTYLTPEKFLVCDCPLRRASQMIVKKASIPTSMNVVDSQSGQPTGDSKGAQVSLTELNLLAASGLDDSALELIKFRGGDLQGFSAMNAMLSKYGRASIKTLQQFSSGVESTKTLQIIFACAMLKTNFYTTPSRGAQVGQ